MGVGLSVFGELVDLSTRFRPEGRSLMLGRQRFRPRGPRDGAARLLRSRRPSVAIEACRQPDGYAEAMFAALGFGRIETLDYSDFEGASLLWDLNRPVPAEWHGAFAFIFDGGTIEHVFDVPQALRNVFDLLAPGGRFVAANPLNNGVGHGLYQFGPELIWSFWGLTAGCIVHRCRAIERDGGFRLDFPKPQSGAGRRQYVTRRFGRGDLPVQPLLLWSEIEKPAGASLADRTYQSDYVTRWDADAGGAAAVRAKRTIIGPAAGLRPSPRPAVEAYP